MKKLIVLDVVGLTKNNLKDISLPNISKICEEGFYAPIKTSFPAVTCTAQASLTSGFFPSEHGIISNGYYDPIKKQISFWEQSSGLVEKPRIWNILKNANPKLKTAILFWQNSLFTDSDIVITPKPIHLENQMIMWCYSKPSNYYEEIIESFGEFDLKWYWGPFTSIKASQWICDAAKYTIEKHGPDLILVYLPHLDYAAQKYGPQSNEFKQSSRELDEIIGNLLEFLSSKNLTESYEILILSEYSFNQVNRSISPNLILKEAGLLATRKIKGKEYLDFEFSKSFAMVDHQVAHIFIKPGYEDKAVAIFNKRDDIAQVLDKGSQKEMNINHRRSGHLILCSEKNSWFNYYWWNDIKHAPPFAFNVDIHRKPGYDPLELFLDPKTNVISQDTNLVKGSHGLIEEKNDLMPLLITSLKPRQDFDQINILQVAPTISKFFGVKNDFPNKPII